MLLMMSIVNLLNTNKQKPVKERTVFMKKIVLKFAGLDSWCRPVYQANDQFYVDVDPRRRYPPNICTKANNEFDGEPDFPIPEDRKVVLDPSRHLWD